MVDALFCLIFAPMVKVIAGDNKGYFSKLICDNGELIVPLSHILTHYDISMARKIRKMLNEVLCDKDKQRMAHTCVIDEEIKKLLSFNRLSVEIFVKLEALRNEETNHNQFKMLKALHMKTDGEENFFLNDEEKNTLEDQDCFEDTMVVDTDEEQDFE